MRRLLILMIAGGMLWPVAPATGELLVTTEGSVIETQGPWKVKGKLVIFTNKSGVLSSLRLSEVDLEASEKATRQAAEAAEEAKSQPAQQESAAREVEPVLVLTDESFPKTGGDTAQQEAGAEAAQPGEEAQQDQREREGDTEEGQPGDEMAEALEEMGEAMAEGASRATESLGEFMIVAAEVAERAQAVERKYDLDTEEGMRAAAGDMEMIAADVRVRAETAKPGVKQMLLEMAQEFEQMAELARTNPEAAIIRRKANQ